VHYKTHFIGTSVALKFVACSFEKLIPNLRL